MGGAARRSGRRDLWLFKRHAGNAFGDDDPRAERRGASYAGQHRRILHTARWRASAALLAASPRLKLGEQPGNTRSQIVFCRTMLAKLAVGAGMTDQNFRICPTTRHSNRRG